MVHPDDRDQVRERWGYSLSRRSFHRGEGRLWHAASGKYRHVEVCAVPMFSTGGELREWFGAITDVDENHRVEEERERILAREKEARETAEAANRVKDEFLATISHELRTPLTAILGWSKMLREGEVNEPMHDHALETIERNAQTQAQLIDDLLDVSRIIAGKIRFEPRPMNLPSAVDAAVEAIRPTAEAKSISLHATIDRSVESIVGDPTRVQQIVWNLLANAVKFTPLGGTVEISVMPQGTKCQIQVKDSGAGIKPGFLPYVFERFMQADQTAGRIHGGLGLGLAIVRHMVELHGGTVAAMSEGEGCGSTFTVILPIPGPSSQPSGGTAAATGRSSKNSNGVNQQKERLKGLHVHIVDDEPDVVELLKMMLEEFGAKVTTSLSASEAILQIQRERPDLLVSDVGLPVVDGYQFIEKLRQLEEPGASIPAIALTAHVRADDKQKALAAGFQTHLAKPIEPLHLLTAIEALIHRDAGE
jgi:signal transduction histidine kinase/CheY-like chemotaxis protein